jgi:phosphoserine phosphatase RsbU/P
MIAGGGNRPPDRGISMDSPTSARAEARAFTAKQEIEARTAEAIDSGDFKTYQVAIMHDWLRTLSLMATLLVPWFFVLDLFMMPASLLPRFAIYRGLSTLISFLQLLVVRRTKPSRLTYLHGYIMTFQIGGMIALMTHNLGGFSSSYYAGLNLVVMGVNLLMPWGGLHTAANVLLTIALYLAFNVFSPLPVDPSIILNNLFFLFATGVLATAINIVRAQLIRRE